VPLVLPASRKVRGLIAYLVLSPGGVGRSHLCDLLWDVPNDPRGELRWSLSKIRSVLDAPERHRVEASQDRIALELSDCFIDAIEIDRALQTNAEPLDVERLRAIAGLFRGEFLEGLQIEGNPQFNSWLSTQRHRFRTNHIAVIEQLVAALPHGTDEMFLQLQTWLQLAPFDRRAHEVLMIALAECGRVPDAEEHLAATIRQFEVEGLNWLPLRETWRNARVQYSAAAASVVSGAATQTATNSAADIAAVPHRASIAVMPFVDGSSGISERGGLADGLAEDIITRLAKLRVFFVIARGTVFALGEHQIGPQEAGRILNVDYVVSGTVRRRDRRVTVAVELAEARGAHIRWAEEFEYPLDNAFDVLDEINNRIVAAVAEEIEIAERNRAILKPPNSLDAWEAYHRGLWHMYKFNGADNAQAEHFFRTAVRLDPTFARAYAGLSFTHFQNAFLHRIAERPGQTDLAFETAGQSLMVDDRDPAAHWAMGRALWLRGREDESLLELARSVELSPNFALGHYTLGFVHCQSGDAQKAIDATDYSRRLSPFDPLQFAMLASRAIAHVRLGQFEEAVDWALKAAARPNAHTHVLAIATHCLAVANRLDEARAFAALIRKNQPRYCVTDYLAAFRFAPDTAELFRRSAQRIGFG
jgi:TolB-like protein/Flp pilus assembly protein TadD